MFSTLKRKRSGEDEIMSDASSNRSSTSPPASDSIVARHFVPIGIHSRTMKRWRNDRPTEEDVHNYTLNKLFSAQHRDHASRTASSSFLSPPPNPHSSSSPCSLLSSSPPSHCHSPSSTPPSSFSSSTPSHPFFAARQQPQQAQQTQQLFFPPQQQQQQQQQMRQTVCCSDCDRRLEVSWDEEEWSCKGPGCGKYVCGTCSIGGGDVGTERVCLDCAMCR